MRAVHLVLAATLKYRLIDIASAYSPTVTKYASDLGRKPTTLLSGSVFTLLTSSYPISLLISSGELPDLWWRK